jgi:hypothetical protein
MPGGETNWRKKMNKKFIFTASMSLILVACAEQWVPVLEECQVVKIPADCNPNPPAVTLNSNGHTASPPNYCVRPGKSVVFRVKPVGGDTDTVRIIPKNENDAWLSGRNDPDPDVFVLTAPDKKDEYKYYVAFKDGHCIDPMIKVQDDY